MTPIVRLYWLRVVLGIVAGVITAIIAPFFGGSINALIDSITIALVIYLVSYYILKRSYGSKVEKQSKILSTGIGMYFFSWLAFFILFYTIVQSLTGVVA
jgi:purine-cytosine permease-like protein